MVGLLRQYKPPDPVFVGAVSQNANQVALLRDKIDELEEENRQLRDALQPPPEEYLPLSCGMRRSTHMLLSALLRHGALSPARIAHLRQYNGNPFGATVLKATVSKIRRWLRAQSLDDDVSIVSDWQGGYYIEDHKRALVAVRQWRESHKNRGGIARQFGE